VAEQADPTPEEAQAAEANREMPPEAEQERSFLWQGFDALWYYHPLIFLTISLAFAAVAYSAKPERVS
jgi:hypothetical protein